MFRCRTFGSWTCYGAFIKIVILKVITNRGIKELEMEMKCLREEFVILKAAIEEAINKGQLLVDDLNDIPKYGMDFSKDFVYTYVNAGLGVVGWVDNF